MKRYISRCVFPFDPVCGELLDGGKGSVLTINENGLYGFCCEGCRDLFLENPELFINYREKEGKRNVATEIWEKGQEI